MTNSIFSRFRGLAAGVAIVALIGVVGCRKSLDVVDNPVNTPVAGLMAFNLATDKAVGVSLSGNNLTNFPLSFNNYTGNYLRIYTGTRTFESRDANNGNTLATTSFAFDSAKYYSAFVLGKNGAYKNVVVEDNFDSLSATNGQAYLRYINAIPDSANSLNVNVSVAGSSVSNRAAAYGSVSDFVAVAPGQVNIAINNGSTISKDRAITLQQQKVYTVLLVGAPTPTTTADSVQIRFIENGTLDNSTNGQRTSSASQTQSVNVN
jgi:hypothetical protein